MKTIESQNQIEKDQKRQITIGVILVLSAALCFSMKAIFAKIAYQYPNVDASTFLTLRMVFSVPFYIIIAIWTSYKSSHSEALSKKDFFQISVLGMLGFYLAGLLDLIGLQYISASLERLILFLYPTIVVLFSWIFFKQTISKRDAIALSLSYFGILIVFLHDLNVIYSSQLILGSICVFLSAISFATYIVGSGKVIARFKPMRFTAYAMIVSCIFTIIQFCITNDIKPIFNLHHNVYYLSLAMGVVSTVLPSLLFAEGMLRVGSNNAAMLNTIGPVATIYLASEFLGEKLSFLDIIGSCFVLVGVLLIKPKAKTSQENISKDLLQEDKKPILQS